MVVGLFQILQARAEQDVAGQRLGVGTTEELGDPAQCQVNPGGAPAETDVPKAAHRANLEFLRVDQFHQGRSGIGAGEHRMGRNVLAVRELDALLPASFDPDAMDLDSGPDLGPGRGGGGRQRLDQPACAAFDVAGRTHAPFRVPGVQHHQRRAGGHGPLQAAGHPQGSQGALQFLAGEPFLHEIQGTHRDQPQKLVHVAPSETAEAEGPANPGQQLRPREFPDSRGGTSPTIASSWPLMRRMKSR